MSELRFLSIVHVMVCAVFEKTPNGKIGCVCFGAPFRAILATGADGWHPFLPVGGRDTPRNPLWPKIIVGPQSNNNHCRGSGGLVGDPLVKRS